MYENDTMHVTTISRQIKGNTRKLKRGIKRCKNKIVSCGGIANVIGVSKCFLFLLGQLRVAESIITRMQLYSSLSCVSCDMKKTNKTSTHDFENVELPSSHGQQGGFENQRETWAVM